MAEICVLFTILMEILVFTAKSVIGYTNDTAYHNQMKVRAEVPYYIPDDSLFSHPGPNRQSSITFPIRELPPSNLVKHLSRPKRARSDFSSKREKLDKEKKEVEENVSKVAKEKEKIMAKIRKKGPQKSLAKQLDKVEKKEKEVHEEKKKVERGFKMLEWEEKISSTFTSKCRDRKKGIKLQYMRKSWTFECVEMFINDKENLAFEKKQEICKDPEVKCCASCKYNGPVKGSENSASPEAAKGSEYSASPEAAKGSENSASPEAAKGSENSASPEAAKGSENSVLPEDVKTTNAVADRCLPNPCKHGGTCNDKPNIPHHGGFECVCHVAYRGTYCQDKTDLCSTLQCSKIKDCVASPAGTLCICAKIPHGKDQSCLSEKPLSEFGQVQAVVSKETVNTAKHVIAGVVAVLALLVICTCVTCIKASAKLREMERLYVEAVDKGYMPPEQPPEMAGVCIDIVKTTLCCAKSSYPTSYLPQEAVTDENMPLVH